MTTTQPIPSVLDRPNTWHMPNGDVPDPTGAEYETSDVDDMCGSPFDVNPELEDIVICTRPTGHKGSHVAGDYTRIIAIWDPPLYRIEEEPV